MKEIDRIEFESIAGMGMWQEWRMGNSVVTRVPGGFIVERVGMSTDISSGAVYVPFPAMAEKEQG